MPEALSSQVRGPMLEDFRALSRILTGVENLDVEVGRRYLDRLTSTPFEPSLRRILERFRGLGQKGGLEALQAAGVDLNNVKIQNNVHNKGFVFDHKKVVVSSMNWSAEGVLNNRDAGVVIDNATAAGYYEKILLDDWKNHAQQKMAALGPEAWAGIRETADVDELVRSA